MDTPNDNFGLIYGLTNPYFKGMVKIGLTHNLDVTKRIHVLNTAVPEPFSCAFAYKVPHDSLYKIEHLLHDNYADKRVGNSEFFRVEPCKVDKLMSALGKFDAMKTTVQEAINTDVEKRKSPNMDFFKMGLHTEDTLVFVKDTSIICSIVSNKRVIYNNIEYSLSELTRCLLGKERAVRPAPFWKTKDGTSLTTLYISYVQQEAEKLAILQSSIIQASKS